MTSNLNLIQQSMFRHGICHTLYTGICFYKNFYPKIERELRLYWPRRKHKFTDMLHLYTSIHMFLPMLLNFCYVGPQNTTTKKLQNSNKKRIYNKSKCSKLYFTPRQVKFYTDNVRASVTNSMSVQFVQWKSGYVVLYRTILSPSLTIRAILNNRKYVDV